MHKIEWSEDLSIGIDSIDTDHKHLISIMNDLFYEIEKDSDRDILMGHFKELEDYTHYHFEREEKLMSEKCLTEDNIQQIRLHIKQHKHFIKTIPHLKEKLLTSSSKAVSFEVINFLTHWLLDHIIAEDLSLTQCFSSRQSKKAKGSTTLLDRVVEKINMRLSLSKRALLIIAVPLFFITTMSLYFSLDVYQKYRKLSEIKNTSESFIGINLLINNLQRENSLSTGYISSQYEKYKKKLDTQRVLTSTAFNRCMPKLKELQKQIKYPQLSIEPDILKGIRNDIDNRILNDTQSTNRYTQLMGRLIKTIKSTSSLHMGEGGENLHASLLILQYLKENSGLLQSEGISILQKEKASTKRFKDLIISDRAYLKSFYLLASEEFANKISKIEGSKNCIKLKSMQELMMAGANTIDADIWFDEMSVKMDAYEKVIENILQNINNTASDYMKNYIIYVVALWVILLFVATLTFFISYALKQSIVQPIETLTKSMQGLASGNKAFYFNTYKSDDIIGKMILAFNNFRRSLIKADFSKILLEIQEKKTEDFEKMAYIDPLTNALNRRKYMEILEAECNKAKLIDSPLSILVLDIDKFKMINDTYGHDTGDRVLKEFTKNVQAVVRRSDAFARIGGEEFSLVLPDTNRKAALNISKKILKSIENINFDFLDKKIKITASIGISCHSADSTLKSMIKLADQNLYEAKNSGRNRVCG